MFTHSSRIVIEFNSTTIRVCRSIPKRRSRHVTHCFSFAVKDAAKATAQELRRQMQRRRLCSWDIVLSVPRYAAMARLFTLPSRRMDEIAQMVDVRIGREIAGGRREAFVYHSQLIGFDDEGSALVSVFLLPKAKLTAQLDILEQAGVTARCVTISTQGLLGLLPQARPDDPQGRPRSSLLLNADQGVYDFTAAREGRPIFSRTFSANADIVKEVKVSLELYRRLAGPRFDCGDRIFLTGLADLSKEEELKDGVSYMVERISPAAKIAAGGSQVSFASVMGLALQKGAPAVDLTPVEVRRRWQMRRRWRVLGRLAIWLQISLLVASVFFSLYIGLKADELMVLGRELISLAPAERALRSAVAEALIDKKVLKTSALAEVFESVYRSLPARVFLTEISLDDRRQLRVAGASPEIASVFGFLASLEKSSCFKSARLDSMGRAKSAAGSATIFKIRASVKE